MAFITIPSSQNTILKNALIYLNDPGLMQLQNNLTPGIYDIAYYVSSFEFVVFEMLTGAPLNRQIEIIELAKTFNPSMNFYIRFDASTVVDQDSTAVGGDPYAQIKTAISTIYNMYNSAQSKTIQGVWVQNFDFPNVGFGSDPILSPTKSGYTFRDCQLYTMSQLSTYNFILAYTCTNYQYVTNVNFILKYTWKSTNNSTIYFNSTCTMVNTNLYGSNFNIAGNNVSGYASQPDFMYNMLLVNNIRTDKYNLEMKFCLCITAANANSYVSSGFFTPAIGNSKASGVAQAVYRLATWLNADYICNSSYPDFYLSETPPAQPLINYTFDYDTTYADNNANGKIVALGNNTIGLESQPSVAIEVRGQNTASMWFKNSNYPIIVP